jgi:hypothetical protein
VSTGARPVRRRTALALAGAGLLAVAGCDGQGGSGAGATPTAPVAGGASELPGASATSTAESPTTPADPDQAVVEDVLAELVGAERLATAAGAVDLALLHRAHIHTLDGAPPAPSRAPSGVSTDRLRRREERLHQVLVDAAMAAESGPLARLLASMSAAVSQQLATLGAAR